jgi:hypothetical protein
MSTRTVYIYKHPSNDHLQSMSLLLTLMIIAAGGDGPLRNTHLPITTPFEQA